MSIILASASPRRLELMNLITSDFSVCVSNVEEIVPDNITPIQLVESLAQQKCKAVADTHVNDVVIGCDTIVEVNGEILGKPCDKADATRMMKLMANNTHKVHTGVCIIYETKTHTFHESSLVHFTDMTDEEIEDYVCTDEPYDKAGGYGIQGVAAKYIEKIEGCYYNIMGLPVSKLYKELKILGLI